MRPGRRDSTIARCARKAASTIEWVTNSTVMPRSRQSSMELLVELLAGDLVERRERLVEQQQVGLGHQRARERGAHAHAARKLGGIAAGGVAEADLLDRPGARFEPRGARDAAKLERQRHVVEQVAPRQQVGVLEDVGDRRPSSGRVLGGSPMAPLDVADDGAAGRPVEAGDQPQQGRLAAARRPQQGEELAGLDVEVDALDGDHAAVELTADAASSTAMPVLLSGAADSSRRRA